MSDDKADDWEDELLDDLVRTEEQFILTSSSSAPKPAPPNPTSSSSFVSHAPPPLQAPPPFAVDSYSPRRELSQRPTTSIAVDSPSPTPNRISDNKDLEIDRLKRELEHATKQIANLEKEHVKLKKERDNKEDQLKSISSRNEEENASTKRLKAESSDTLANKTA